MNMIDINRFYHRANEKGLVRDEKVRLSLTVQTNPKLGVNVKVLMDYNLTTSEPGGPKHYAYAATILFNDLMMREYDRLVDSAIRRFGRNDKAKDYAVDQLLKRDDVVFITKDETILKHPLMTHRLGTIDGTIYGSGEVNGATWETIAKAQKEVTGPYAFEDKLYQPVNPLWLEQDKERMKANNSEMSL